MRVHSFHPHQENQPQANSAWLLVGVLTLLAALLRSVGLNSDLWYDEIRTLVDSVRSPFLQIVTTFPGNNQHSLYSILAHLAITLFGEDAWSLRLPAFVFGVASVPLLYWVALSFTRSREALLAAGLLAVSYHHIWFSQNARGYTALVFFTLLSTAFFVRLLRVERTSYVAGYAVASALGVYTHLTMVTVVISHAGLGLLSLIDPGSRRMLNWRGMFAALALAGVLSALLYAPIFFEVHTFFADRSVPEEVATPRWAILEMIRGLEIGWGGALAAVAAGMLIVMGLRSYARQNLLLACLFVLPGVLMGAAALVLRRPVFPRFFFFLIGFGLLILVRGAMTMAALVTKAVNPRFPEEPRALRLGTAAVAVMLIGSLYSLPPLYRYPKQDFTHAMEYVQEKKGPDDLVATVGLTTFVYLEFHRQPWNSAETLQDFRSLRSKGHRVWLLYTLPAYIAVNTPELMEEIRRDCPVIRVFRGTLRNGEVVVCAVSPMPSSPRVPVDPAGIP